jgi:hypothetical protein
MALGEDIGGIRVPDMTRMSSSDVKNATEFYVASEGLDWRLPMSEFHQTTAGRISSKLPVKSSTTVNKTLSGEQTVNGVAAEEGDRILVMAQTNAVQNGIYVVSTGAWTRADDFTANIVKGMQVVVTDGNHKGYVYRVISSDPIVIGTTAINFEARVPELTVSHSASSVTDLLSIASEGRLARLVKGVDYTWTSPITLSADTQVIGSSPMIYEGSMSSAPIAFGTNVRWDDLNLVLPAGPAATMVVPSSYRGERIRVRIEGDNSGGSGLFHFDNNGFVLEEFDAEDIARPFMFFKPDGVAATVGGYLGRLRVKGAIRAFSAQNATHFTIRELDVDGTHADADGSSGQNCCLFTNAGYFRIVYADLGDAPEHTVRFGGDGVLAQNVGWDIATLISRRPGRSGVSGGCHLKINADHRTIGRIGRLIGKGGYTTTPGGNHAFIRCSHGDLSIGYASASSDVIDGIVCNDVLQLNDIGYEGNDPAAETPSFRIGHLDIRDYVGNIVSLNETQDTGAGSGPGPVKNVMISKLTGENTRSTTSAAIRVEMPTQELGRFRIHNMLMFADAQNEVVNVVSVAGGVTGRVEIQGTYSASSDLVFTGVPDNDDWRCEIRYANHHFEGRMANYTTLRGPLTIDAKDGFNPANVDANQSGVFVTCRGVAQGQGALGGALILSRPGAHHPGAALVSRQDTANLNETSLAFFVGAGSVSTEELLRKMILKWNGTLNLQDLPEYANNAAALAGGLVAGDFYRATTGDPRPICQVI